MRRSIMASFNSPDRVPPKASVAQCVVLLGVVVSTPCSLCKVLSHWSDLKTLSPTLEIIHWESLSNDSLCIWNILRNWRGENISHTSSKDCQRDTFGFARVAMKLSFWISCIAANRFTLRTCKLPLSICSRRSRIVKSNSPKWSSDEDVLLLMSSSYPIIVVSKQAARANAYLWSECMICLVCTSHIHTHVVPRMCSASECRNPAFCGWFYRTRLSAAEHWTTSPQTARRFFSRSAIYLAAEAIDSFE
jgi:hypothetical protein